MRSASSKSPKSPCFSTLMWIGLDRTLLADAVLVQAISPRMDKLLPPQRNEASVSYVNAFKSRSW